jgi:hypothetical protein
VIKSWTPVTFTENSTLFLGESDKNTFVLLCFLLWLNVSKMQNEE